MESFKNVFPLLLMILLFGYLGYYFYKKNKENSQNFATSSESELWKKARWGLIMFMPFLVILEVLIDDLTERNTLIIATVINWFVSKYIFNELNEKDTVIQYPKLSIVGISIVVLIVQFLFGTLLHLAGLFE